MDTPKLDGLLMKSFDFEKEQPFYYGDEDPDEAAAELATLKKECDDLVRQLFAAKDKIVSLVDAVEKRDATLSRIDYLLGTPNDREVSDYDLHSNPDAVLERFESDFATLKADYESMIMSQRQQLIEYESVLKRYANPSEWKEYAGVMHFDMSEPWIDAENVLNNFGINLKGGHWTYTVKG